MSDLVSQPKIGPWGLGQPAQLANQLATHSRSLYVNVCHCWQIWPTLASRSSCRMLQKEVSSAEHACWNCRCMRFLSFVFLSCCFCVSEALPYSSTMTTWAGSWWPQVSDPPNVEGKELEGSHESAAENEEGKDSTETAC